MVFRISPIERKINPINGSPFNLKTYDIARRESCKERRCKRIVAVAIAVRLPGIC